MFIVKDHHTYAMKETPVQEHTYMHKLKKRKKKLKDSFLERTNLQCSTGRLVWSGPLIYGTPQILRETSVKHYCSPEKKNENQWVEAQRLNHIIHPCSQEWNLSSTVARSANLTDNKATVAENFTKRLFQTPFIFPRFSTAVLMLSVMTLAPQPGYWSQSSVPTNARKEQNV